MTDHASLLSAIIANPDEDAPRLIYADWLEEQGESARAEFIRVQCELARTPHAEDCPCKDGYGIQPQRCHRCSLRGSECVMVVDHGILPRLFPYLGNWYLSTSQASDTWKGEHKYKAWVWIDRGFVREIHCRSEDWLQHGPTICKSQPVQKVVITDKEPYHEDYRWRFFKWIGLGLLDSHALPERIFNFGKYFWNKGQPVYYDTAQLAMDAMNAAYLAWGQEEARK